MLSRASCVSARAARMRVATSKTFTATGTRSFASESSVKRPKAIKVKKSDARRRVDPKQETALAEQQPQDALTEVPPAQPPSPFLYSEQQQPQTFGQLMKMVRLLLVYLLAHASWAKESVLMCVFLSVLICVCDRTSSGALAWRLRSHLLASFSAEWKRCDFHSSCCGHCFLWRVCVLL